MINELPTAIAFPWTQGGITCMGMTLRDYFAAKAMQGALSGCAARGEVVMYSEMASLAYEMADAMMEARK